jgi:hypothetical protein
VLPLLLDAMPAFSLHVLSENLYSGSARGCDGDASRPGMSPIERRVSRGEGAVAIFVPTGHESRIISSP